jgi:hypothetical protein
MNNNPLINALVRDFAATAVSLGTLTGTVTIDYTAGHFQSFTTGGNISLQFTNWPIAGQYGAVTLDINVTNINFHIQFPSNVSVNTLGIQGFNFSTNNLYFLNTGVYSFSFSTTDNGTTVAINQSNNILNPFNHSATSVASAANINPGFTTNYFTSAGTAYLPAGIGGVITTLTQTVANATMTVSVQNAGWVAGNIGNCILSNIGSSCTLQYFNFHWYCIGNNGATFS